MTAAAARLARVSSNLTALQKTAVKAAADAVQDALEAQAERDTGGDGKLSGYGPKARYLGVQQKPITDGVRLQPEARGAYGQWLIVEAGADPHDVAAKAVKHTGKGAVARRRAQAEARASGARGAYSGARPLNTPWGPRYRLTKKVHSPAKRTWSKGVEQGRTVAVDAVRQAFAKAVAG